MLRVLAAVAVLGLSAACSTSERPSEGPAGGGGGVTSSTSSAAATSSSTSGSAGAGGASCAVDTIDLKVTASGGVPSRIHVPVTAAVGPALLMLDTGSALSFLYLGKDDPDFVPDAGEVAIGCATLELPGRGGLGPAGDEFGLPVVGTLGADFLIDGATLLDTANALLVRRPLGDAPPETSDWTVLDYDDVQGHVIAPATLDGVDLRLMLDTGSPHVLWLGQQGQPGDTEVTTEDAEGTPITLYYGTTQLEMASRGAALVPVLRAPSFPYFEATVAALGGNIHGLLGLSAFRGRPLLFDGASNAVRLGPVPR